MPLTLAVAQSIVRDTLVHARKANFKPLCVVVLDQRGAVVAVASEDGTSLRRFEIAKAKAHGAVAFNVGSRKLDEMAVERPHFVVGAVDAIGGGLVPVPGGVLIKNAGGAVIGAVGVSGDTSDNDEAAAIAAIVRRGS